MNTSRPILRLSKKKAAAGAGDSEVTVQVGIYDLLLPSRRYDVHHKVAVLGEVSLTTEFLLRLLHAVDGMSEQDVARFFDFNDVEMAFVVNEAESRTYISREGGRLWLTDYGYSLFKDSGKPQIFEVEKRKERVGFDLLSLAPCEWEFLSEFESSLPELEIRDADLVANASKRVPESFRRFYGEISSKRDRDVADQMKRSLYSIDEVVAGDRFSSVVPVVAVSSTRRPADPEPALEAWRPAHEVSERESVVHGVATFLDDLKVAPRAEDNVAYQVLLDVAPEFLRDFTTRDGLSVLRYFKEIVSRAGELRSDRPTIGIVGPLCLPDNRKRVSAALSSAGPRQRGADDSIHWVVPIQSTWGASRALHTFLESIKGDSIAQVDGTPSAERNAFSIVCGRPPRHLIKAFDSILLRPDNGALPAALEVLLVPQRIVAVTVHAPLLEGKGFPVPLGILSFDPNVVRRTHQYLVAQLAIRLNVHASSDQYGIQEALEWENNVDLCKDGEKGVIRHSSEEG